MVKSIPVSELCGKYEKLETFLGDHRHLKKIKNLTVELVASEKKKWKYELRFGSARLDFSVSSNYKEAVIEWAETSKETQDSGPILALGFFKYMIKNYYEERWSMSLQVNDIMSEGQKFWANFLGFKGDIGALTEKFVELGGEGAARMKEGLLASLPIFGRLFRKPGKTGSLWLTLPFNSFKELVDNEWRDKP